MDEFSIIERYFKPPITSTHIDQGIGDDCAILSVPPGKALVFSIDTLVAGRHFLADADPELIGQRALCVALSDLAAMGAEALCCTLALSLPVADTQWLDGFSRGLHAAGQAYGCALVGGDTVKGPLVISIQVHGLVPEGQALRRSGAKPGDHIFVSGTLGDAAGALKILQGELDAEASQRDYLLQRYYHPEPQLSLGKALRSQASAAIDISDGLLADLGHICRASGVGAELDLQQLPCSQALRNLGSQEECRRWALSGGDDYQLCFTIPERQAEVFQALASLQNLPVTRIGQIVAGNGIRCAQSQADLGAQAQGYRHF